MFRICLVVAFDGSHFFLFCSGKVFVDPKGIHFLTLDQCQCSININNLFWNNHSVSFCNIRPSDTSIYLNNGAPHNGGVVMLKWCSLPFSDNWRVRGSRRDEAYHLSMILYWREEHLQLPCAAISVGKSIWTTHLWQLGFLRGEHRCNTKKDEVPKEAWFLGEFEWIWSHPDSWLLLVWCSILVYTLLGCKFSNEFHIYWVLWSSKCLDPSRFI